MCITELLCSMAEISTTLYINQLYFNLKKKGKWYFKMESWTPASYCPEVWVPCCPALQPLPGRP